MAPRANKTCSGTLGHLVRPMVQATAAPHTKNQLASWTLDPVHDWTQATTFRTLIEELFHPDVQAAAASHTRNQLALWTLDPVHDWTQATTFLSSTTQK